MAGRAALGLIFRGAGAAAGLAAGVGVVFEVEACDAETGGPEGIGAGTFLPPGMA